MFEDKALFKAREPNDESLIVKLNKTQKEWIRQTAAQCGITVSRFILDLVDAAYQRWQDIPGSGDTNVTNNNLNFEGE